jgi:cell division protein FtsW (lipid II flippase)
VALSQPLPSTVRTTRSRAGRTSAVALRQGFPTRDTAILGVTSLVALAGVLLVLPAKASGAPGAGEFSRDVLLHAVLFLAAFLGAHLALGVVLPLRGRRGDALFLPLAQLLTGVGFAVMVGLSDVAAGERFFAPFVQGVVLGLVAMVAAALPRYGGGLLSQMAWLPLLGALGLSAALLTLGGGPGASDARVNLLGAQPIEVIRLLTALFLAGYFARRWAYLRDLDEPAATFGGRMGGLRLPRLDQALPVLAAVGLSLAFFFLQKDLGPALLLVCVFLALYAVCRGHVVLALVGLMAMVGAFALAHATGTPRTVHTRVAMWLSPWENGERDQLAQSLWAFASGGRWGTGLGLGSPSSVQAVRTDLPLAAVGEELGFVGIVALALAYVLLVRRGLRASRRAPDAYTALLALALTLSLAFEVLWIAGGALGLVPLSGVVTPFLSFGRSALIVHLAVLGMLWSISAQGRVPAVPGPRTTGRGAPLPHGAADSFGGPVRVLGFVLAGLGACVVLKAAWIQLGSADRVMARPVLVRQADGVRRFQDNPRLLQVAASIPRGSILDRNGLPLAASRWAVLEGHEDSYARLGATLSWETSDRSQARHYPLAGRAYHILGDLPGRRNWGASNTSFVERDSEPVLGGFDDHAAAVTVSDPRTGRTSLAMRRDLRELVPLWRRRHRPRHPIVREVLDRPRDVRLALDAGLQARAADALREILDANGLQKGAVVVVDADGGDLLASVSAPWPTGPDPGEDALLDRARFGAYPPGSGFKLVTAAAALAKDRSLVSAVFPCAPLPGGRVGAVVGGRVVRDDRGDRAHGGVTMETGIVGSCNAYFAQLGPRVGWDRLEGMAGLFRISLGNPRSDTQRRAHLVDAAFGQGAVVASPLQMARVAAAIAAEGTLAPTRAILLPEQADHPAPKRALDPESARRLGGFMRGVVLRGTGRRLAGAPVPIAGKTGTAQVGSGAPHAWFVGYAPADAPPSDRIAFAVLLEHGGYGGEGAAQLAGRVVEAASDLGLLGPGKEAR